MARVVRCGRADRDLLRILAETAIDRSRLSADRLLTKIERKASHYARLPLTGIPRDDLAPDLRCFLVKPFLVFYRPIADGIEVARIMHGSRDIRSDMFGP
jgi:toxin ParE1/3/4